MPSDGARLVVCHAIPEEPNLNDSTLYGGSLSLWEIPRARKILLWEKSKVPVTAAAFSPDGKTLLLGIIGFAIPLLVDISTTSYRQIPAWPLPSWEWSPGMPDVVHSRDGIRPHTAFVSAVIFSDDGKFAASGGSDDFVTLWDVATGRDISTWTTHDGAIQQEHERAVVDIATEVANAQTPDVSYICALAFSNDGKSLISSSSDGSLTVRNITTQEEFTSHPFWVSGPFDRHCTAFSPDGKIAIIENNAYERRLWDIGGGMDIAQGITARRFALSRSSKWALLGSSDGEVKFLQFNAALGAKNQQTKVEKKKGVSKRKKSSMPDYGVPLPIPPGAY